MMATKRTKEELYGHDPELKRALNELTHGKDGEDPMYMAPPATEQGPTFDANRFQQKTAPPGFLEFARTAVSPALKLEQEQPKPARPKPSAAIAGVPVYSAPMAPPVANEQTLEVSPVLLAGGVSAESDPRRADTLMKIRIAAPRFSAGEAAIVPSELTKRSDTQRLMQRSVAVVLLLALVVIALTLALSPTARSRDEALKKTPVDAQAVLNAAQASEAPAALTTPPEPTRPTPTATPSSELPPVGLKQEEPAKANAGTGTATAARSEIRTSVKPPRPTSTEAKGSVSKSSSAATAAPAAASEGFFSTVPGRPPAD